MNTIPVGSLRLAALRQLAILAVITSTAMADEFHVTMDDVIAQWTLREEQAQNVRIELSERSAIPAKSSAIPAQSRFTEGHGAGTQIGGHVSDEPDFGAADSRIDLRRTSYSILLAGEMARYDVACDSKDDAHHGIISRYCSATYNGKYATELTEVYDADAEQRYSAGSVRNQLGSSERLRKIELLPVVLMWRSSLLDDLGFLKFETFRIVDSSLSGEQGLITISNRDSRCLGVYEIDLAVDQDLVPVEVRNYSRSQSHYQDQDQPIDKSLDQLSSVIEISYSNDSDHVRVPTGWHIESYANSRNENEPHPHVVRRETDVTLTHWDLDPFFSEDLFELQAPPDTRVNNQITGEDYILRADGSKRMITNAERSQSVTYQMLVDTESGMAAPGLAGAQPNTLPVSRGWLVVYVSGFTMLCLAVFAFLRRNRRVGE